MRFDLTASLAELSAWDFVLVIDGVDYPTRPMSMADLRRIEQIAGRAQPDETDMEFVASLFAGANKPPVADADWREENLAAAISAILGHFKGLMQKKCRAIAVKVASETIRPRTLAPTSSPPSGPSPSPPPAPPAAPST